MNVLMSEPLGFWLTLDSILSNHAHWAAFLSPLVLVCSVFAAIIGIRHGRQTTRMKATLDLIERFESTEHYIQLRTCFSQRRMSDSFAALNVPKTDKDKKDRQAVLDYLNHYEIVAIGINTGILDKGVYSSWMTGALVRDWNAAADFIQRERRKYHADTQMWSYNAQIYENYQRLVADWAPGQTKWLTEWSDDVPAKPEGPGDEPLIP